MKRVGLVEILEAAYSMDDDAEAWMKRLATAVDDHLQYGLGLFASRYRIDDQNRYQPYAIVPINLANGVLERVAMTELPPEYVNSTYRTVCGIATEAGDETARKRTRECFQKNFVPIGLHDCLTINGLDPTRNGFLLAVWMPRSDAMTPRARTRLSRVATHLAASNRLRQRLEKAETKAAESAEAILTASGRVEHAEGDAKTAEARAQLARGAQMIDHARGRLRRTDPDLALAEWKGLIAARWTLIEHYESDGKRYVLARRNEAVPTGFDALTVRERQAVGFASLGHSNKLIAYEMGISASTVGVLVHRAAKKLGARSRDELVASFSKSTPPPE